MDNGLETTNQHESFKKFIKLHFFEFQSRVQQELKPCKNLFFVLKSFKSTPNSTTINNCYDNTNNNKTAF